MSTSLVKNRIDLPTMDDSPVTGQFHGLSMERAQVLCDIVQSEFFAWEFVWTTPPEVLAGAVLGIGVGYPTTACLVSFWGLRLLLLRSGVS